MLEIFKRDFKTITWILIPIAIIANGAGGWVITRLNAPLYLDTIGTIFIAIVAGPFAGAITGVITNVILGIVSPGYIPYWPVPMLIGLAAGFFAMAGWFKHWWKVVIVGILLALIASIFSSLIAEKIFGEISFNPSYFLVVEPVDKIVTTLIAFGIGRLLPEQIRKHLPRPENIESRKTD
ncbi:MAG TPA: hypothetical protein DCX53_08490 [Anaerolineae bacterium]|nr:hypothetical protein [Anaerolineae bacterium]